MNISNDVLQSRFGGQRISKSTQFHTRHYLSRNRHGSFVNLSSVPDFYRKSKVTKCAVYKAGTRVSGNDSEGSCAHASGKVHWGISSDFQTLRADKNAMSRCINSNIKIILRVKSQEQIDVLRNNTRIDYISLDVVNVCTPLESTRQLHITRRKTHTANTHHRYRTWMNGHVRANEGRTDERPFTVAVNANANRLVRCIKAQKNFMRVRFGRYFRRNFSRVSFQIRYHAGGVLSRS